MEAHREVYRGTSTIYRAKYIPCEFSLREARIYAIVFGGEPVAATLLESLKPLMKNTTISILATAAMAAVAFNAQSDDKKKEEGHGHKSEGLVLPMPPMSPIPSPKGAKVYIVQPKDGKTVKKKFKVVFGLKGMGVAPAGIYMGADKPTGHHHLMIDSELPDMKLPFPMDEKHLHFGGGQTETMLELPPGKHTLQLVLGDHAHIPHDPPVVSEKITITVEE